MSRDQHSNFAGSCLKSFALKQNLYILNGSVPPDHPGTYTFMAGSRCSTIDYILVCSSILVQVKNFQILPYIEGDHFPLFLQISSLPTPLHLKTRWPIELDSCSRTRCRVKWSLHLQSTVKEVLDNHDLQSFRLACTNPVGNHNPITHLEVLISKLGSILFKPAQNMDRRKKGSRISKPWFDRECMTAKKNLTKAYKNFAKAPGNSSDEVRDSMLVLKKSYKKLVVQKKKEYIGEQWRTLIQATKDNNTSLFWRMITNRVKTEPTPLDLIIPADSWVTYFKCMYGDASPQIMQIPDLLFI